MAWLCDCDNCKYQRRLDKLRQAKKRAERDRQDYQGLTIISNSLKGHYGTKKQMETANIIARG